MKAGIDRIYACRKRLAKKMNDGRIDLLLCPTTVISVAPIEKWLYSIQLAPAMPHALPTAVPYTALMPTIMWNAMDFPAGVVTVGG